MSIVNRSSTVDNINNQEEMSVLDYDNLSNRVTRFWLPYIFPRIDVNGKMMVFNI